MGISKCKKCNAKIMWVKTVLGNNMPIDYDEELEHLFKDRRTVEFDSDCMTSHFATCPNADEFRRS